MACCAGRGRRRLFDQRRLLDQQIVDLVVERIEPGRQIGGRNAAAWPDLNYTLLAEGFARSGRPVLKGRY